METAEIRALDRKLTDGLNLVHDQFTLLREEQLEDRKELRAEIAEVDERAEERAREQNKRLSLLEAASVRRISKAGTALERQWPPPSGAMLLTYGGLFCVGLLLSPEAGVVIALSGILVLALLAFVPDL